MPRHCFICTHRDRRKIEVQMASGVPDREISRQLGKVSHVSVARHRKEHFTPEIQARHAILTRGSEVREKRKQLLEAAANPEGPTEAQQIEEIFSREGIGRDTILASDQLKKSINDAVAAGVHSAVAQLTGQQFRGLEFRARMGGLLGPRSCGESDGGDGGRSRFAVNIVFGSHVETIEVIDPGATPTIDSTVQDIDQDEASSDERSQD
jgi:hypothetical protein